MKTASKNDVLKQVKILDIVKKFGIKIEPAYAGNFDYKCICPSSEHKSGKEKTSSLHINSSNNDFYCFGCNRGSSSIDFYMFCTGKNFSESMKDLREMVKDPGIYSDLVEQKKATFPILLESSEILRTFLKENPDKLSDKNFNKLLYKLDNLSFEKYQDDPEKIMEMNQKLKKLLES